MYGTGLDKGDMLWWLMPVVLFGKATFTEENILLSWWLGESIEVKKKDISRIERIDRKWYYSYPLIYVVTLVQSTEYKNVHFSPSRLKIKDVEHLLREMGYDSLIVDK